MNSGHIWSYFPLFAPVFSNVFNSEQVLVQFSSVAQSCPTLRSHGLQHARLPGPSPTPGACSNSHPSSWWYHPTISSSVVPFSYCLQSFPASESFPKETQACKLHRWFQYSGRSDNSHLQNTGRLIRALRQELGLHPVTAFSDFTHNM